MSERDGGPDPDTPTATMRSAPQRVVMSVLGALLPLVLGSASLIAGGPAPANVVVSAIGLVLCMIVAVDFPLRTVVTPDAVVRHCPARRHHLDLDAIDRFTRTSPRRHLDNGRPRVRPGAPVATIGRRRFLLLAVCETRAENDAACAVLALRSEALADTLRLPPGGARDDRISDRA